MSASVAVEAWIVDTLEQDTQLAALVAGVWVGAAPVGTTGLFVVVDIDSSFDTNFNGGARALSVVTATVRVIGSADGDRPPAVAPFLSAFNRVDALLHNPGVSTSATGARIDGAVRTAEARRSYTVDGVVWSELGGRYRVGVS